MLSDGKTLKPGRLKSFIHTLEKLLFPFKLLWWNPICLDLPVSFLPSFEKALSLLSGNYLCSFARISVTLGAEFSTTTPSKALVDGKLPTHILFSRILGCGDSSSRHIFKQFWGSMLFSVNQVPRAL